jgi:predicted Zn-dependent protease
LIKKAKEKAQTPMETALADAMITRLEAKADAAAETQYAQAVLTAVHDQPDATDLRLLASEADLAAWRRGDRAGGAKAEAIIAPILKTHPNNSAAIHYYIHATEMAGHPVLALPYAKHLAELAPGASHLVHMAAHTFFQAGLYEEAAVINARALAVDADHLHALGSNAQVGAAFYFAHNQGFGEAGAMISGDAALAVRFADDLRKAEPATSFDKDGLAASEGRGFIIYGRYAPDRMMALADPGKDRPAAQVMYHYARGEVMAGKGDAAGVRAEADAISQTTPQAQVAKAVLHGRAAMLGHDYSAAAKAFDQASDVQGQLFATQMDPPPWWYYVRRSVAAAKLEAGQYAAARDEAQASLTVWKNDPLALLVLSRAQAKLGDKVGAAKTLKLARAGWHGAPLVSFPAAMI